MQMQDEQTYEAPRGNCNTCSNEMQVQAGGPGYDARQNFNTCLNVKQMQGGLVRHIFLFDCNTC